MQWIVLLNYMAWYVFVFIGVVWIIVLLQNSSEISKKKKASRSPTVSVLIPAYNEEKTIGKTIESVLEINYPKGKLEVIVINDCSTDRTGSIAKGFGSRVKLLNNSKNMGKSFSLNRGIKVSRGELISCIDADSVVERDILKKMVGYFDEEKVACVTPALMVWERKSFLQKIQYTEYLLNVFLRKMLAFMDSIHVTPGVFSMYRKSVLVEVGGFDVGNLTEDMEIALKMHQSGYKIENEFDAASYTMCPNKWSKLFRQRIRWYRGALENMVKYKHMLFNKRYGNLGVFLLPINLISIFAIIAIFLVTGWNVISSAVGYAWKMSLVGWDFGMFMEFDIGTILSSLITTPLIFGALGLSVGGYVLYKSFKLKGMSLKSHRSSYAVFLVIYPFIMMVFWSLALTHEVFRFKKKW